MAVTLAITLLGCGKDEGAAGPRIHREFVDSKSDVARAIAKKLAYEAYPQWAARPTNQGRCPSTDELAEYVNQKPGFKDPWGEPYLVKCGGAPGAREIAVLSKGKDGREGTDDDQRSWDER